MKLAYIALGANLGKPITQITTALQHINKLPETAIICVSSFYQSEPIGYLYQPDFINAVAKIQTQLSPESLLEALLAIEKTYGRTREFKNAPRPLDLDILSYDNLFLQSATLHLPHPRMRERAFVMLPLQEISPDFQLANISIKDICTSFRPLTKVAPPPTL